MPHIHIFLQELDRLYQAGDFDLYEQYWLIACQHAEHFFQGSRLPMPNCTTQAVTGYRMVPCIMSSCQNHKVYNKLLTHHMHPEPEYTRHERFIQYAEARQDVPQWVVWRAELEDGRRKKVPYNPNFDHIQARASVKIPKSWGILTEALTALKNRTLPKRHRTA